MGISDESYTQILSGLQEGDKVAYLPTSSGGEMGMAMTMMPGGMSGGMSGGMPSGGMSGGPGGRGGM